MSQTICAIATAQGGAIGIIRVSGQLTFITIRKLCKRITPATPPRTTVLTPIIDITQNSTNKHASTNHIDDALVTLFPAPHSYTGEDCAEISCHGSSYILQKILELLIQQGCRIAKPGEFTQRAFLNGKIDLSQAEAVADIIASTNSATHKMAMSQLRGHFSAELTTLRNQLLHLTTLLELELDFSDHEDLEFANRNELQQLAKQIDNRITHLAQTFETGQALKNGIPVAIVGKTNVGKSTLLNRLLHEERAIVSDIHGTTRDTIEDTINIHGVQFRFIDTAGLRQTNDKIEQIGIERTYKAIEKAHIVLWLIDKRPSAEELKDMSNRSTGRTLILIINKADLFQNPNKTDAADIINKDEFLSNVNMNDIIPIESDASTAISPYPPLIISAKTGQGLDSLETTIYKAANIPDITDNSVIITNLRHFEALTQAQSHLTRVLDGLQSSLSTELIAEDLRLVINALGEITGGTITTPETLNNIFSHFCVGK